MQQRWLKLCTRLGVSSLRSTSPEEAFTRLAARYTEPHRAYHNLRHIEHCLDELALLEDQCLHPDRVEAAIWFHDLVYDPRATDNEERSADLARQLLSALGTPTEFGDSVATLIAATTHQEIPASAVACVLVDVDLAILGQPEDAFDAYEQAIRREYAWVEDDAFAAGRTRILRGLLARPRIYATAAFLQRYEDRARANLRRSISRLDAGSDAG